MQPSGRPGDNASLWGHPECRIIQAPFEVHDHNGKDARDFSPGLSLANATPRSVEKGQEVPVRSVSRTAALVNPARRTDPSFWFEFPCVRAPYLLAPIDCPGCESDLRVCREIHALERRWLKVLANEEREGWVEPQRFIADC